MKCVTMWCRGCCPGHLRPEVCQWRFCKRDSEAHGLTSHQSPALSPNTGCSTSGFYPTPWRRGRTSGDLLSRHWAPGNGPRHCAGEQVTWSVAPLHLVLEDEQVRVPIPAASMPLRAWFAGGRQTGFVGFGNGQGGERQKLGLFLERRSPVCHAWRRGEGGAPVPLLGALESWQGRGGHAIAQPVVPRHLWSNVGLTVGGGRGGGSRDARRRTSRQFSLRATS
jgi:hypothetical protein